MSEPTRPAPEELTDEDNGAPLPEGVPLLVDAAQAVVREWEKDHTVESMDELITAICFHPAITKSEHVDRMWQCPECTAMISRGGTCCGKPEHTDG